MIVLNQFDVERSVPNLARLNFEFDLPRWRNKKTRTTGKPSKRMLDHCDQGTGLLKLTKPSTHPGATAPWRTKSGEPAIALTSKASPTLLFWSCAGSLKLLLLLDKALTLFKSGSSRLWP